MFTLSFLYLKARENKHRYILLRKPTLKKKKKKTNSHSLYLCNYNGNGRCMITGEVKYKIEENIKKYSSLAKMSLY